ncbi:MAG TPA: DUF1549 and DUF1553 domain-containing protein [Pirellulales bacterium]|nr:DUF1549 and DUF1553 domain-containing protein [Pirellulales bacterium]
MAATVKKTLWPRIRARLVLLAVGLASLLAGTQVVRAADAIAILPAEIALGGPEARQQIVVERTDNGQFFGQVAAGAQLTSSNPKVVSIEDGLLRPVANGEATITATVGGATAAAHVVVADMDKPFAWSFRNHVESVFSKTGCNSGACHGALAGKNGFKLSLRGYDPEGDFSTLTRQARGRRMVPTDPGRSLLLTKPSGAVPHKGGLRFSPDSLEYRVIAEWIASGAAPPQPSDARVDRLEILPRGVVLKPADKQQFLVRAYFTDGHQEDVTRWVKFSSANESVVQIDDAGLVTVMGHGEGVLTAWYASRVAVAAVSAPYEKPVAADVFASAPRRNFIDELALAKLASLNIPPSPPAADAEFLRRAFLDTIGVLPTIEEARAFLADTSADKRDKLIESLLARPEFVDYWAYKWSDLLLVNSEKLRTPALWSYYTWIRNQVEANTPWDEFARQIVTAKGGTLENGATNYYVLHGDPLDLAETTTVTFLGMSINCARCHNHPLEKWTNSQYFAFANLFARVRTKTMPGEGNLIVYPDASGELIQPLTGKPQRPAPLDGQSLENASTEDRRLALADWLVAPENPYFSRSITNRVWANFFGVGLVEKVDDMRLTNPASNEQLLAATAKYLVDNRYDLKALMRTILQSNTYQRASRPSAENAGDDRFYSHYYPRRLMAEVLLDAMSQVTGAATEFAGYPAGWRAMQLPDSNVASYFLKAFGRPERAVTCECERTAEPSVVQVLHIANGNSLNDKLQSPANAMSRLLAENTSDDKLLEGLYLAALSRYPTEAEKAKILPELAATSAADKRQAVEDMYWSVLSSTEFLFNH